MKIIRLTRTHGETIVEYLINCDKIHIISKRGDITWVNLGNAETEFQVDQTPDEIIKLINGGNK